MLLRGSSKTDPGPSAEDADEEPPTKKGKQKPVYGSL